MREGGKSVENPIDNIYMSILEFILYVALPLGGVGGGLFFRHQKLLTDRAHLMREAVRARDFSFRLPVKGLFFGEKALQEALNDMGKDISTLVAKNEVESWQKLTRVLTHEIMNATTPISSISQAYLGMPEIKGTVYEEGIRAIHDTSVGLTTFVDSYRKFTQLQEPVPQDVNVVDFFATIRNLYGDVNWHIDIPEGCVAHTDPNLLRQVVINIVKNAVEAGAKDVDVRCSDDTIYISNNGEPIPADVAREIFIPFFTTKRTGTGIGLALSRQIMIMQGGDLLLAERGRGGYSVTFELKSPLRL